ncbi:hypothetical protein COT52_01340 [candidate division WWE3 bacterium CG08_land_8_20_14_0_20_43_13]|uniref:Uncharacterized protein n=1 Tax=candidate division WWE3 bacterium CG08_land_8_20_14_0_20_43_13 TaxID=1975087 RepID=A0A2H0X7K1_UNCKA|nr:MAG: hypothetical protein COT52_01340 [candidate division WWE3 bacterium CG08_land_8_20_14_0_20_43_13]
MEEYIAPLDRILLALYYTSDESGLDLDQIKHLAGLSKREDIAIALSFEIKQLPEDISLDQCLLDWLKTLLQDGYLSYIQNDQGKRVYFLSYYGGMLVTFLQYKFKEPLLFFSNNGRFPWVSAS